PSGTGGLTAIGALLSASRTQWRSMFALSPRANATAAIDTPGCWQAPIASALNSSLWRRRRRRPVEITSFVDTCTPPRLAKVHPYIGDGTLRRCIGRTLTVVLLQMEMSQTILV